MGQVEAGRTETERLKAALSEKQHKVEELDGRAGEREQVVEQLRVAQEEAAEQLRVAQDQAAEATAAAEARLQSEVAVVQEKLFGEVQVGCCSASCFKQRLEVLHHIVSNI